MGGTNGIVEADGNADKYGLMPFLSEDGTQNVFVLNVNRFYGLNKKLVPATVESTRITLSASSSFWGSCSSFLFRP